MELLFAVSGQTPVLCVLQEYPEWHFLSLLSLFKVEMDCKAERGFGCLLPPPPLGVWVPD